MKKVALILIIIISLNSCKSSRNISSKKTNPEVTTTPKNNTTKDAVIENAKVFSGVKYKYGGNTKKGMDCSGLVSVSFKKENINLPRTTSELSKTGDWIDIKKIQKGDLIFFATKRNSRKVNHVGIVTSIRKGNIEFIHASTSKGVIISSLKERYWYVAYVQARRVL